MNNENLSQEEAARRADLVHVDSYDVHVDLTHAADSSIASYPTATTLRFTAQDGAETFLDYIHHSVESVKVNGELLNTADVVEGSRIHLKNLAADNVVTVHGRSFYSRSGEGLHRYIDPEDGKVYLYTQYEPADSRRVFPNFEQPDLKAVFNFRITAPKNWVVSSNAPLEKTVEDPSDASITKRVFAPTARISTYITTILAGEYHVATDTYHPTGPVNNGSLPLVAYCRQSLTPHFDVENIFAVTKAGLDFYQELFDFPYPFPKYEQAFVPEYNLGAMENPGLVTFTENYLFEGGGSQEQLEGRANVICHEMSHMWFGDLVTMKWWNDLWLKESFAEFMGTLGAREAAGFEDAWVSFANNRKAWAYGQDQLPTTHPIVADIPHLEAARQNFDGITYAKGASVLKQLVAFVGFDSFIAGARLYFQRHAWKNTTLDDFLAALDECSSADVLTWAQAWLQTSGLSTLRTRRIYSGPHTELLISQDLPEGNDPALGRPHRLKVRGYRLDGETLRGNFESDVVLPPGEIKDYSVHFKEQEREALGASDLIVLNAEDLTYAKIVLSEEDGLEVALRYTHTLEDAMTRGLIWSSLWNQVRDARLSTHRFVTAVARTVLPEQSATLLNTLLLQAQQAIRNFTPAPQRQPLWDELFTASEAALKDSEEGGDKQLILMRAMLSLAAHTAQGEEFARAAVPGARGETTMDYSGTAGLALTQTLGWAALISLAAQDKVDRDELQSVVKAHPSAIAQRGYAHSMAAFPGEDTKTQAFDDVLTNETLSNDILTATAQGYQEGDEALRQAHLNRYFDTLETTWQSRSIGMATRVVLGLFPHAQWEGTISEHPVVEHAEKFLRDRPDAPVALRRLIIEQLDHTRRSLQGQAFNAVRS
ncbi:aminopeptidase N [Rothia sp. LK2588]|uniref:aminopeptidase N n=1 Tax=Rothia sp. LK2588 TaxID=3114369 RepID=UPI0034CE192F